VLQCVAMCCNVLNMPHTCYVSVVLQVCCSMMQCAAVALQGVVVHLKISGFNTKWRLSTSKSLVRSLQRNAECNVLQRVAVHCSALQYIAVCCSV